MSALTEELENTLDACVAASKMARKQNTVAEVRPQQYSGAPSKDIERSVELVRLQFRLRAAFSLKRKTVQGGRLCNCDAQSMQVMAALKVAQGSKAKISNDVMELRELRRQTAELQAQLQEVQGSRDHLQDELQRSLESKKLLEGPESSWPSA